MIPAPFIVILDANVLFPLTLRDTLLRAASDDYFQLKWSAELLDEMTRNLVSTGSTTAEQATRLRAQMERVFPEAMVTDYESMVPAMQNDPKDRHVVAAALVAGAQVIVTNNLKDFIPVPSGIQAQSADEFLCNLLDLDPTGFVNLLHEQASDLTRPPVSFPQLLGRLEKVAPQFAETVRLLVP